MAPRRLATLLLAALVLAGCRIDVPADQAAAAGGTPDGYHRMADGTLMADAEAASNGHDHDVDPADLPSGVDPVRLEIPTLGLEAPIVATQMSNARIQGPPVAGDIAWLEQTRRPGEIGPAVLGGVDVLDGEPGAYAGLRELTEGDTIRVVSANGDVLRFYVEDTWSAPVSERQQVFLAGGSRPEVRLVDWALDGETEDHVVVAMIDPDDMDVPIREVTREP